MRLPKIYDHFQCGQIFTIDEAREALNSTGNTLRKRLCELATRGYLSQIRQGMYRLMNPEAPLANASPLVIASKLTPFCYIGFRTALKYHVTGEIPIPGEVAYVVSSTKFNGFEYEGVPYYWCQSPDPYGLDTHLITDEGLEYPVLVTNFEKTLVDCLKRPQHGMPLSELIAFAYRHDNPPDLARLFTYACDEEVAAVFNKVGYFLELMQRHWNIPNEFLEEIRSRMTRKHTSWSARRGAFLLEQPTIAQVPIENSLATEIAARWKINLGPNGIGFSHATLTGAETAGAAVN
jgi:predicted transcriptional regulator of viral defense system